MITVHFFAAARAAAGQSSQSLELSDIAEKSPTLADLTAYLAHHYTGRTPSGMSLAKVLEQCSFLVNGSRAETETLIPESARVDVMPPFAGG
ncbi:MoaD/ThiS family protein [uncultured Rothia sp.]|uniref:MoaD/ThiS family protein n=1 Tax=uncultured Rothia sp. TaxID=316088 RepID=UPI003217914A